jgi:hypothetical protein
MAQGLAEDTYRIQGKSMPPYGMPSPSRLATWGTLATLSLGLAMISAHSSASRPTAAGARSEQSTTSAAESGEADAKTRRLIEAVRALAADREQLLTRMASLERNLADVTGSIKRDVDAASQRPLPQMTSTSSVAGGGPPQMRRLHRLKCRRRRRQQWQMFPLQRPLHHPGLSRRPAHLT